MFLQQIINGITVGSTYALVTIGFNMVYGVLELTNFAHSSFYMLGAYISLFTMTSLIGRVTPTGFFIGLLVSIIITSASISLARSPVARSFSMMALAPLKL